MTEINIKSDRQNKNGDLKEPNKYFFRFSENKYGLGNTNSNYLTVPAIVPHPKNILSIWEKDNKPLPMGSLKVKNQYYFEKCSYEWSDMLNEILKEKSLTWLSKNYNLKGFDIVRAYNSFIQGTLDNEDFNKIIKTKKINDNNQCILHPTEPNAKILNTNDNNGNNNNKDNKDNNGIDNNTTINIKSNSVTNKINTGPSVSKAKNFWTNLNKGSKTGGGKKQKRRRQSRRKSKRKSRQSRRK